MATPPRARPVLARTIPQRRPPAAKAPRNVADAAHAARADAEVASAVAAVDAWYESASPEGDLDLTHSSLAAVEAAEKRAADLGVVSSRLPGKSVVVRMRHPPARAPEAIVPVRSLVPAASAPTAHFDARMPVGADDDMG